MTQTNIPIIKQKIMEKKYNKVSLFAAICALLLASCSADDETLSNGNQPQTPEVKSYSITANIEDDMVTRASLGDNEDGYHSVKWEGEDHIGIYNSSSLVEYKIADKQGAEGVKNISTNGKSAEFIPVPATGIDGEMCAYYPYSKVTKSSSTLSIEIPSDQTPTSTEGKTDFFNPDYQFMTGYSSDGTKLTFSNQLALLRITISDNLASAIKVVAAKNGSDLTYITGTVNATVSSAGTSISLANDDKRSTFVEARASSGYLPAGTYYFAVVPNSTPGFTILIEDWQNEKAYQRVNKTAVIEKNNLYDLGSYNSSNVNWVEGVVDLGLPTGTLWCNHNVGASSPTEVGNYYAWGETEVQPVYALIYLGVTSNTNYVWDSYKLGRSSDLGHNTFRQFNQGFLMRYNSNTNYQSTVNNKYFSGDKLDFLIDNQSYLAIEDDAANKVMGEKWTMPTYSQMDELIKYCNIPAEKTDGCFTVSSKKYKDTKGNWLSIKLPAGGYKENKGLNSKEEAQYWTKVRSTNGNDDFKANRLTLSLKSNGIINISYSISSSLEGESRAQGRLVRAVLRNEKIASTYKYNSNTIVEGTTYTLQSLWKYYEDNCPKLTVSE